MQDDYLSRVGSQVTTYIFAFLVLNRVLSSVERVTEYLHLPQESARIIETNRPPAYWPSITSTSESMITVKDLVVRYAPTLPAGLHGVSFEVKHGEKIGIIGRTGQINLFCL